jgi:protein required for attachment to host cells
MPANVTWVLIADGNHAKVFEHSGPGTGLKAIPELMFEEQPVRAQEVRVGRSETGGTGAPTTAPTDAREGRFMKAMAATLDEKLRAGAFRHLVIVAEPTALGEIRPCLSKPLQQVVVAELPKDLTRQSTPDIERHLGTTLQM